MRIRGDLFGVGLLVAALAGALTDHVLFARQPDTPRPLRAQLFRFELRDDVEPTFQAWMQFLRDEHPAVLATLDREQMYVEGIFRDREREPRAIYWLAVQGAGGAAVESSAHDVDRKHVEFMGKTLAPGSRRLLSVESWLLAPFIDQAIRRHGERP